MFHEIAVYFLYYSSVELFQHLFVFLLVWWEFKLIFFSVWHDVFCNEVFDFVSVFELWELAEDTINSVEV